MTDRMPQWDDPSPRLVLVSGLPGWRAVNGEALVCYEPSASPATVVLSAYGEFDSDSVDCFREAITGVCTTQTERVLLELTGVTFADSAFVNELLAARDRCRLILVGPLPRPVRRLLKAAGVLSFFHIALDDGPE
ncbi:STAS domain-containing protein [Streptomyces sp. NPDC002057]|uniref:STAS domain-containing protein n=1 Tax=Streptomyces sp. NPDC002057 TaxID=3154664 RepID=UPI00331A3181